LHPDTPSVHQIGLAIDTDEQLVAILNDHGWYQTVYRNGRLVEPWHFEYQSWRDNHINEAVTLIQTPDGVWRFEEDELNAEQANQLANIYAAIFKGGVSMPDGGRPLALSISDIANGLRPTISRDVDGVAVVNTWVQELADIKTIALAEAVETLSDEELKAIATVVVEEIERRDPKA
jgi:hypothetical protein